ncbi:hypothetical protein ACOSQ3_004853 [Xanthoceras sorbifolium]
MLAKEMGKLIHLKYLGLSMTLKHLDCSIIFNSRRLQTLVVYDTVYVNLPFEISRLQELRHLIGRFKVGLGSSIANLKNLQTLKYISMQSWVQIKAKKLVNLQEL